MKHDRPGITLYNVMFPIWMLWLFPLTWLIILPVNFGIDLLVVVLTVRAMGLGERKRIVQAVVLRVWLMGFVADLIGTGLMFLTGFVELPGAAGDWWYNNLSRAVSYQPFESIYALLYVTLCIGITGVCIYWFNRKFCLHKAGLTPEQTHKLALSLAVFTAPYLFYFPSAWIY